MDIEQTLNDRRMVKGEKLFNRLLEMRVKANMNRINPRAALLSQEDHLCLIMYSTHKLIMYSTHKSGGSFSEMIFGILLVIEDQLIDMREK